jgi:glycosyltransferase involved in cell wall biosynthesis
MSTIAPTPRPITGAKPFAACSIASNNYLAYATVWAESFREHHPEAELFVCLVDRPNPAVDYQSLPFRVLFAQDLGIPAFDNFAFRYDILELNTAVKPFLLTQLRDRFGFDRAFYFDPDILVLSRMQGLIDALDEHSLVVTPHITEPLDDMDRPQERLLRMAGIYNLGFVGFRLDATTERFLDWWKDRLYRHCVNDIHQGLFVDQSWMDFAPAFVERTRVLRDPIYNVAYWNLPHRLLHHRGGRWEVDGRAVGFFHFSGLDLGDLEAISRHQDRLDLSRRPELRPLFEGYRAKVYAAGHAAFRGLRYGYATFAAAEIPVPPFARRLLQRIDPWGRRWPDPFEPHREDSYLEYLMEPLRFTRGRLNRVTLTFWEEREDLMRAFPDVCGVDLPRFASWLTDAGEGLRAGIAPCFLAGIGAARGTAASGEFAERFSYRLFPYDATVSDTALRLLPHINFAQPGELAPWLTDAVPGTAHAAPVVTRLMLLLYRQRGDLQRAFPDPLGEDQKRFAHWFCREAQTELNLADVLVEPVRRSLELRGRLVATARRWARRGAPARVAPPARTAAGLATRVAPSPPNSARQPVPPFGVNLAGYFTMDTGVAQVGRGTRQVLQRLQVEHVEIGLDRDLTGRRVNGRIHHPDGAPHPVTLLHANADETPRVLGMLPSAATAGGRVIGCWYWELSHFPISLAQSFESVHEIWAPSRFCEAAFRPLASVPVRWVPPCVPAPQASAQKGRFGLDPARFTFLVCFDARSIPERKNPLDAIAAFAALHREQLARPIGMVIKMSGAKDRPEWIASLREAARGLPIEIRTETLSRDDVYSLIASCDALVSLHRSEGLGLLPLEALYLGKPVIATEYGGLTDFLDDETGYPVRYDLRRLERDFGPYPAGAVWAFPEVDHAVAQMRAVVQQPLEATRRAAVGKRRVDGLYSIEAAARRYAAEFDRLRTLIGSSAVTAAAETISERGVGSER